MLIGGCFVLKSFKEDLKAIHRGNQVRSELIAQQGSPPSDPQDLSSEADEFLGLPPGSVGASNEGPAGADEQAGGSAGGDDNAETAEEQGADAGTGSAFLGAFTSFWVFGGSAEEEDAEKDAQEEKSENGANEVATPSDTHEFAVLNVSKESGALVKNEEKTDLLEALHNDIETMAVGKSSERESVAVGDAAVVKSSDPPVGDAAPSVVLL